MARAGRFTEARIYVVATSVALVLVVWAALAVSDRSERTAAAVADAGEAPVTGAPENVPPVGRLQIIPQTRTRGS